MHHADQILTNDIYVLYQLTSALLLNNPDLRYIFVLDGAGRVVVSSFEQGLPIGLREANAPSAGEKYRSK